MLYDYIDSQKKWTLAQKTQGQSPLIENSAARLWDIGDGVACLELTTENNYLTTETFALIERAIAEVALHFKGMIIGDDDADFSLGLDMRPIIKACERDDWESVHTMVDAGQQAMIALKQAPFPIVGCAYGKALDAGCTLLLHCDAIQAHEQCSVGLDQERLGLTPCLGGCKELLLRHLSGAATDTSKLLSCEHVFRMLSRAEIASSAKEARRMRVLREDDGVNRNRERLLPSAKARCLALAEGYAPPIFAFVTIPAATAMELFRREIRRRAGWVGASAYEQRVWRRLAGIITGGGDISEGAGELELIAIMDRADTSDGMTEIGELQLFGLERDAFLALLHHKTTRARVKEDAV